MNVIKQNEICEITNRISDITHSVGKIECKFSVITHLIKRYHKITVIF